MHPQRACEAVEGGMRNALKRLGEMRPLEVGKPVAADLTFKYTTMADAASRLAGAERLSDLSIRLTAPDAIVLYRPVMTAVHLGMVSMVAPMK